MTSGQGILSRFGKCPIQLFGREVIHAKQVRWSSMVENDDSRALISGHV